MNTILLMLAAANVYVSPDGVDEPGRGGEGDPYQSIGYAVSQTSAGDTILLKDGVYCLTETVDLDLSTTGARKIRGASGDRTAVVVDGQNAVQCFRLFNMASAEIRDLTISNALNTRDGKGGGAYLYAGMISNCVLRACTVATADGDAFGGGVHLERAAAYDLLVENCIASNCYASTATAKSARGGGVYAFNTGTVVRNSTVRNCRTVSYYTGSSSGSAQSSGGGIVVKNSAQAIGCVVTGCSADNGVSSGLMGSGGGIYVEWASISDCLVSGNEAYASGGGIALNDVVTVSHCTIVSNKVTGAGTNLGSGGGVYAYNVGTGARIENCRISDNRVSNSTSAAMGGGIMLDGVEGLSVADCVISGNSSCYKGGGIGISRQLGTKFNNYDVVSNCVIAANFSQNQGGMLYDNGALDLLLTDCWCHSNTSKNWGAIAYLTTPSARDKGVTIRNSFIKSNWTSSNVGIDITSSVAFPVEISHCTFIDNRCDLGIVYAGSATVAAGTTIRGCAFANDSAGKPANNPDFNSHFLTSSTVSYSFSTNPNNYPHGTGYEELHNLNPDANPAFADPQNGNFRPLLKSPLRSAGGAPADWMTGAKDLGQGDPIIKKVGEYGVSIVRVKAKNRLLNGNPTIGCSEAWEPTGLVISVR